jgi:hypothetical protein
LVDAGFVHAGVPVAPAPGVTAPAVYRTPGRTAELTLPRPSLRVLLQPLRWTAGLTLVVTALVVGSNGLAWLLLPNGTRFVPMIELEQDAIMVGLLASPVLLGVLIARRVAPLWTALRWIERVGCVTALLLVQLFFVAASEAAVIASRGGIRLFEPTYQSSFLAPDGRSAHVYAGGLLGCTHEIWVSAPLSPTMTKARTVEGSPCSARPHVRWNGDRSVELIDDAGNPIHSHSSGFLFFGRGC